LLVGLWQFCKCHILMRGMMLTITEIGGWGQQQLFIVGIYFFCSSELWIVWILLHLRFHCFYRCVNKLYFTCFTF
jgi:hypothetical protein